MKMRYLFLFTAFVLLFANSCKDKEKEEMELLESYLKENNIETAPTESGLYYIETKEGSGAQAKEGSTVKVHYEGRLIDGTVFDSSLNGDPIEFPLGVGYVIAGWDEGISYMKEGGEAQLIIPSKLAYGDKETGSIPAYSTLIFDVSLIEVGE